MKHLLILPVLESDSSHPNDIWPQLIFIFIYVPETCLKKTEICEMVLIKYCVTIIMSAQFPISKPHTKRIHADLSPLMV